MQSYGIQKCLLLILPLLAAQTTTAGQHRPARSLSARTRPTLGRDPQPSRIPALQRTCAVTRRVPRQTTPGRRFGSFTDNLLSEGVRRLLARGPIYPSIPLPSGLFQLIRTGTFSPRDGPPKVRPSFRPPRPNPRESTSTQEPKRVLVTLSWANMA